jgi:hypothetical protein
MKTARIETLPAALVRSLRACRHAALLTLEPLDYAARLVNGRGDFPPLRLRRHGLSLKRPVAYGNWSGLREGLSFQDLLVVEKSGPCSAA